MLGFSYNFFLSIAQKVWTHPREREKELLNNNTKTLAFGE